jgi:hypothetical protein
VWSEVVEVQDLVQSQEPREWEYNEVQHRIRIDQLSVGKSHAKLVVEEELEVSL